MQATPIKTSATVQMAARTEQGQTDRQRSRSVDPTSEQPRRRAAQPVARACVGLDAHCCLSRAARGCAALARPLSLHRRPRHRAIGAEHTTIARLRLQLCAAASALVKELTGVGRHGLRFRERAVRTSDDRLKKHRFNSWARMDNLPSWWPRSVGSQRLWHCHR
jgi:hypothetical protein